MHFVSLISTHVGGKLYIKFKEMSQLQVPQKCVKVQYKMYTL